MKFSEVLPRLFDAFDQAGIDFSLIGGVALYFLGAPRTTFDVDFLILLKQSDAVDKIMKQFGYKAVHHSEDAANYVSADTDSGQVDFLFAHRSYSLKMLQRADKRDVLGRTAKVLKAEDIIGLKVQSSSNDPQREAKDRSDIEELMRRQGPSLDWELLKEYYLLFHREDELKDLKRKFG